MLSAMRLALMSLRYSIAAAGFFVSSDAPAQDAWKERTEVVWSKETHTLIRKRFRMWDPHPELDLEFLWEPRAPISSDNSNTLAEGEGTLSWHVKGAADYDRKGIYSVYKGALIAGRPEGEGALLILHTGYSYTGQWRNGLKQGHGALRFENGDRYDGEFVGDKMDGVGAYTSTDGSVYVGEFRTGRREGVGQLMLADGSYRTTWRDGKEIARERVQEAAPAPSPRLRLTALSNTVKLKLSLNREKAAKDADAESAIGPEGFDAEYAPDRMSVHLASKAMLAAWKGKGEISSGREGGLGSLRFSWQFEPILLRAEVENAASSPAQIAGAFIDLVESATDPEPYLELSPAQDRECQTNDAYSPEISFQNFGWGAVKNARMIYTLGTAQRRTAESTSQLGTFDAVKVTSIEGLLRQLGVDTERLRKASNAEYKNYRSDNSKPPRYSFRCEPRNQDEHGDNFDNRVAACFEGVKKTGALGQMADFVYLSGSDVRTTVAGRIEYQWSGSDGTISSHLSPFSIDIPLIALNLELGEGGCEEFPRASEKSIMLPLDRRNSRIQLPNTWKVTLAPGATKQFDLNLSAAKSSLSKFRVVVKLQDGSEVASPLVELSFFRPRFR